MSQVIYREFLFFLISIWSGILVLCGYDQLRVFRRVVLHNHFFQSLEDFFYWTFAGIFLFSMICKENDGAIRGYSLAAIVFGMWFYYVTLSRWVIRSEVFVFRLLFFPVGFTVKKFRHISQKLLKKVINWFTINSTLETGRKHRGIYESEKKKTKRQ